jgi:DNA-binding IscR family transcriptional regulator
MLPDVISTSGRLLRLVSLLSTRPSWTNGELAERMEVTERTVRRDIAKLRDLCYGIQSDPGPWGGYRLSGGAKVPPLSLDDRCHPADQSEATPAVRHRQSCALPRMISRARRHPPDLVSGSELDGAVRRWRAGSNRKFDARPSHRPRDAICRYLFHGRRCRPRFRPFPVVANEHPSNPKH